MKTTAQSTITGFVLCAIFSLLFVPEASAQMKARVAWTSFASNMSGTWVAQEEVL